ncbi:hypothetical protein GYMLUDRAFT_230308 [Collybiopsis luxurians FD-317 M1]|uniref:Uncharacterized protein n=1 Tax=Collybiopsis luxurians FD-317 M1 TaxID=944289 RepID=A0A0D0CDR5_9AGAR|nr:hypothetical protein GYMLUDRAFT_230308 [Collybiopsis luxurians FD-317 M1]
MGHLTLWRFIREQYQTIKPVETVDLTGQTVIVTGANNGLGFEAAKHFARMNPERLILACRNQEKGNEAVSKLSQETGYTRAQVWILDLASFASVREFADRFEREGGGRLDILVENAGISSQTTYQQTGDGYSSILQTNVLGPSLHALLLLPYMVQTAEKHGTKPRVVFVSSDTHYWASFDGKSKKFVDQPNMIEGLSSREYFDKVPMDYHYFDSKLLNVFFARALQARIGAKTPSIIVNAVNPGYCYSGFRRSFTGVRAIFDWLMEKLLAMTTEEGGRQLVWAAVGGSGSTGEEEKLKGGYVSFGEVVEPSDYSVSEEGLKMEEKYWNQQLEILKGRDSRVKHIVDRYLQD